MDNDYIIIYAYDFNVSYNLMTEDLHVLLNGTHFYLYLHHRQSRCPSRHRRERHQTVWHVHFHQHRGRREEVTEMTKHMNCIYVVFFLLKGIMCNFFLIKS